MEIVQTKIIDLIPATYNPRKISNNDLEQLKKSLVEFEAVEPAVVNLYLGRENIIIGGHQRIKAATELGWDTYPCYFVSLPEDKERELNLRLNRGGEWDFDKLNAEFDLEFLTDVGFNERELGVDFGVTDAEDEFVGDDDIPEDIGEMTDEEQQELEEQADSKPGRVYRLGNHTLVCGDSTDPKTAQLALHGRKIEMVMTDPPYGVGYVGTAGKVHNDGVGEFAPIVQAALQMAWDNSIDGACWYVFAPSGGIQAFEFYRILKEIGVLRHTIVWVKDQFVLGRSDYHYQHEAIFEGYTSKEPSENILYGWKEGAAHITPPDRKRTSIIVHSRPKKSDIHPTMKPLNLVSYLIKNGSERGMLVYDPFMGSGSTLIAAEMAGRVAAGSELSPIYCDAIRIRWTRYAKQHGLEVGDGALYPPQSEE